MKISPVILALGASACAEPAIELSFVIPNAVTVLQHDTSCMTAVEVYAVGNNVDDTRRDCVEIENAATYQDVRNQVRGQVSLRMPESGLLSIEAYGYMGPCDPSDLGAPPPFTPDLIFYAGTEYSGDDYVPVEVRPNLSCKREQVTLRPIELLKLVATKDCVMAGVGDVDAGTGVGTLSPDVFDDGVLVWSGGLAGGNLMGGAATFQGATKVGDASCLGHYSGSPTTIGMGCLDRQVKVCTQSPTETVAPVINGDVSFAATDQVKLAQFGGVVFGAVYNAAAGPVMNATVTVAPQAEERALIEFLDLQPTGELTTRAGNATGPHGLFRVYATGFVELNITANGTTRKQLVGATSAFPGVTVVGI